MPNVTIPIFDRDGTETLGLPLFEKSVTLKLRLAMAFISKLNNYGLAIEGWCISLGVFTGTMDGAVS